MSINTKLAVALSIDRKKITVRPSTVAEHPQETILRFVVDEDNLTESKREILNCVGQMLDTVFDNVLHNSKNVKKFEVVQEGSVGVPGKEEEVISLVKEISLSSKDYKFNRCGTENGQIVIGRSSKWSIDNFHKMINFGEYSTLSMEISNFCIVKFLYGETYKFKNLSGLSNDLKKMIVITTSKSMKVEPKIVFFELMKWSNMLDLSLYCDKDKNEAERIMNKLLEYDLVKLSKEHDNRLAMTISMPTMINVTKSYEGVRFEMRGMNTLRLRFNFIHYDDYEHMDISESGISMSNLIGYLFYFCINRITVV